MEILAFERSWVAALLLCASGLTVSDCAIAQSRGGVGYWPADARPYYYSPYDVARPPAAADVIDPFEPCYRYGRCSTYDLQRLRDRAQRLDRLAPQAPQPRVPYVEPPRVDVPPTAVEEIRPEYRGAGQVRGEFENSGAPIRAPAKAD